MKHESEQIQQTIKYILKLKGKRYSDLAEHLKISLASVKRILNCEDIQVSRLSQIATFLDVDFFELIEKSKPKNQQVYQYNKNQEKVLSQDFKSFLTLRMLMLCTSKDNIKQALNLTDTKLNEILRDLERVDLIELHPHDLIKNKVHFPVKWIEDGLLEKTYNRLVIQKLASKIEYSGINRKCTASTPHINVKELLLKRNEQLELKNKILELIKSYDMLTKVRLKTHREYDVVSVATIIGTFSWWD